jgi:hypothetical protein
VLDGISGICVAIGAVMMSISAVMRSGGGGSNGSGHSGGAESQRDKRPAERRELEHIRSFVMPPFPHRPCEGPAFAVP